MEQRNTILAEPACVPHTVCFLGVFIDVQKFAVLVIALP